MTLLFIANRLALIGVLTVAVVWSAVALGKCKKGVAFRAMAWSSGAGGVIPVLIFPVWIYFNARLGLGARVRFESAVTVLWPGSIALMGLDSSGNLVFKLLAIAVLVLMNAGLYGLLGLCVGLVWQKLAKPMALGREEE
jgi:hypothetical protein